MVQQISPIPFFQLRKGGMFPMREPHPMPFSPPRPGGGPQGSIIFTEYYCQNNGLNTNSGTDTNATARYTTTNGNWNNGTLVFIPTDGSNPVVDGLVKVGDMASVYTDGSTPTTFIGRVVTVQNAVNGTIVLSSALGTAPSTGATGRTLKVGGAWKGPNGGVFPFQSNTYNFSNMRDAAGHPVRVNLKNDQTYVTTASLQPTGSPLVIQGYSSIPGDGGKATIDANTNNSTIVALQTTVQFVADLIIQNSNNAGINAHGISLTQGVILYRCVLHNVGGSGIHGTSAGCIIIECEVYDSNKANVVGNAGIELSQNSYAINCFVHDNTTSNTPGIICTSSGCCIINSIIARNGFHGILMNSGQNLSPPQVVLHTELYKNGTEGGIHFADTTTSCSAIIRNCNFVENSGYGLDTDLTTGRMIGLMDNCGFGGEFNMAINNTDCLFINNLINYGSASPYDNPSQRGFNLVLPASIGTGRGLFTQTASVVDPSTVSYPDVGAAQSLPSTDEGIGGVGGG